MYFSVNKNWQILNGLNTISKYRGLHLSINEKFLAIAF